ncbi:MAG TPA: aldo/keto reductase [Burkholderiales bacterium]|nr:aldo/keto reductase [Burkholderiales bacterium]
MDSASQPALAAGTVQLGDRTVHRMGFGAMRLCGPSVWGPPKDRAAAHAVLRRAVELGIDFIDTADSYGPEVDETLIAEALHPYPDGLIVGTKGGLLRPSPPRWDTDGRPEHLRQALEGSLKRLKLDCIDLYQLHAPDSRAPFADSVGALADAQRAGKIRHIGLSNVSVKQLEQARRIAPIVSVQNRYNLEDRGSEDVLAACERLGIAFLPWFPLGAGAALRSANVKRVAARAGASPAQVLLAWLLTKSAAMLPIPGTASLAHLEENTRAAMLKLSADDFAALA